ncbi:MAG: tRNA adenosine(34) deaminase TadA [Desulfosalsimonadaceae bacterium]
MYREVWMQKALAEAEKAFAADEVPVGAVLLDASGNLIASAHNRTIGLCDASAHAEILVLRRAGHSLENYRLPHTTLYVTIEPCVMCMGALIHARVERIVFGAEDPGWGAAGSVYDLAADRRFNHHPEVVKGVLEPACRQLMVDFFKLKRGISAVSDRCGKPESG